MKKIILFALTITFPIRVFAQQPSPPCQTEAHSEFDFWVGEWTVTVYGTENPAGENTISKTMVGCVIEENWVGASGFLGKSFNTYNVIKKQWEQVWVDQSGNTIHFVGHFKDNVMTLTSDHQTPAGGVMYNMSYHFDPEKDTVRQIWKQSTDAGETWTDIFDGLYVKK